MTDYLDFTPESSGRPPLGLFVRTEMSSSHNSLFYLTRSADSVGLGSFNVKANRNPKYEQLEQLINFISSMPDYGKENFPESVKELSDLVHKILVSFKDPSLKLILRSFGWNGKRFQMQEKLFEREKLQQAVSNVYLKFQYLNIASLDSIIDGEGIHHIDKVAAFAPDLVVEYLKQKPTALLSNSLTPPSFQIHGACMLIDISGFSKFSAAMCMKGAEGLDELRKTTSGMLGRLVKVVYEYEGDVIAFAGDALICVFQEFSKGGLDDLLLDGMKTIDPCFRAIYCAEILRDFNFFDLSTHIGISSGDMTAAFLGGFNGSWTYLVNGPCISQLSSCIEDAAPHHVVVTRECFLHMRSISAIDQRTTGRSYPDVEMTSIGSHDNYHFEHILGNKGISAINVKSAEKPLPMIGSEDSLGSSPAQTTAKSLRNTPNSKGPKLPPRPSIEFGQQNQTGLVKLGGKRGSVRNLSLHMMSMQAISMDFRQPSGDSDADVNSQLIDSLSTFVPRPVMVALHAEANHQIGELRTVTTLFMSLDTYDPIDNADPASLQPFFLIAQQVLSETGGYLRQFLIDDKGCVLIIMWGMPLHTFSNNSSRALYTAYNIQQRAHAIGHLCSIGITTGNVFCGTIGASERLDYVGIGNEVNLAARFMAKAKQRIFVDDVTYANLNESNRALLQPGEPLVLKGMPQPICPYIYIADVSPVLNLIDVRATSGNKLLKKKIMQELEKQLDKLGSAMASHITPFEVVRGRHHSQPRGSLRPPTSAPRRRDSAESRTLFSNSNFMILCGPAGSGKRTAAEYFLISARERGLQTIQLTPKSHHRNMPYGVMKDLLIELMGEEKFRDPHEQRRYLETLLDEAFPDDPDNRALAATTINTMLGFSVKSGSGRHGANNISDIRISVYGEFQQGESGGRRNSHHSKHEEGTDEDDDEDEEEMFSPMKRSKQIVREGCDLSFYRLLAVLLRGQPTAIVIENAQFCDELSWNELYLMLVGYELDISVLLTLKSKPESVRRTTSHHSSDHSFSTPLFNASSISNTSHWVVPTAEMQTLQEITDSVLEEMEKVGLREFEAGMFPSIFSHPHCKVVEMKGLTEDEVRSLLLQTLKIDTISNEVVRLVMDASSGNTYWVKNIASLIKDLGVHEIERKIAAGTGGSSALKTLIHCRLDLLDAEARRIVKLASVVGFEFTPHLLEVLAVDTKRTPRAAAGRDHATASAKAAAWANATTPRNAALVGGGNLSNGSSANNNNNTVTSPNDIDEDLHTTRNSEVLNITRVRNNSNGNNYVLAPGDTGVSRKGDANATKRPLAQILEELEKSGFIYCVMESPTTVYAFQNELLQKTLYEMIMPSDAAGQHLSVARFLEEEYAENLRPFYPSLAFHYRQANDKAKAFKFELKAAALAVTSGAFADGFVYAESAFEFVQSLAQVNVLLEVIDHAESCLEAFTSPHILKTLSSSYASFMFHRETSLGISALNLLKGGDGSDEVIDGDDDDDDKDGAMEASKPFAERRIATEQNTLRNFQRLRNRVEVLKVHIEDGLTAAAEENPDRQSLHHGQEALLRSFTTRKLSWKPSFNIRSNSSRPTSSSVERSPVHRQQTARGLSTTGIDSSPAVVSHKVGCHCVIQ